MEPNTLINARTGQAIPLAMQHLEVTGRVYPVGSFVRVTHRFKCEGTQPMEAIYAAMLPRNGTLRRFIVKGEDFEVTSKLEPRKKAREQYEAGMADGHLSVLAETFSDGITNLSVGQVKPGEEIQVILDMVVGVDTKDQRFRFRFPFTLAPNYHPQAKPTPSGGMMLPEDIFGDVILPEWRGAAEGMHEVSFNLHVFGGGEMTSVESPSHRIRVTPQKGGSCLVTLAGMGDTPNRDLVLEVTQPEAKALLYVDESVAGIPTTEAPTLPKGAPRWTAVIASGLLPKPASKPRKVLFCLDRSGSMGTGPRSPMGQAKRGLQACLSALNPDDEFGIVEFDNSPTALAPRLAKATLANRERAAKWLAGIEGRGGTELMGALTECVRVIGTDGGDIFLLTDGEVYQTATIVEQMLLAKVRVHVLGIGTASQDRFLSTLARKTDGAQEMLGPAEDVAAGALRLFNAVRQPVLSEVLVTTGTAAPFSTGTVWDGIPAIVNDPVGDGTLPSSILLKGKEGEAVLSGFTAIGVPEGLTALLYAGRTIEDIENKMDSVGKGPAAENLNQQLEAVSTAYQLASRAMSLVAVVERLGDQAGVVPEQKIVTVGAPEGQEHLIQAQTYGAASINVLYQSLATPQSFGGSVRRLSAKSVTRGAGAVRGIGFGDRLDQPDYAPSEVNCATMCFMSDDTSTTGGLQERGFYSPTLSVDSLELPTPMGVVGACAAASPCEGPDRFFCSGNLLLDVAKLENDGGCPGGNMDERVMNTILFALVVLAAEVQMPGLYISHLKRMAAFIGKHLDDPTFKPFKVPLFKAAKRIANPTKAVPGDWAGRLGRAISIQAELEAVRDAV